MPDLLSVQPVAGLGNAYRPSPTAPEPEIKKPVDTGAANSSTDYTQARNDRADVGRARNAAQQSSHGDDVLAGPPPAFEASLLEIEGNLEMIIKRLDAARERARDSEAVATPAVSEPATSHEKTATDAPETGHTGENAAEVTTLPLAQNHTKAAQITT